MTSYLVTKLLIALFINLPCKVYSVLLVTPEDSMAVIGQSIFFNCSSLGGEILWFHYDIGMSEIKNPVYSYGHFYPPFDGRFGIEKDDTTGASNLIIPFVTAEDAGRYECQEAMGTEDRSSAMLIVLETNPVCQSNTKKNQVIGSNDCNVPPTELQLTCSVTFYGDERPIMEWKEVGSDITLVEEVVSGKSGNRSITNATIKGESIKDGVSYKCQAKSWRQEEISCTSGTFEVMGAPSGPTTTSLVIAIICICVIVIPFLMIVSVLGGIYLQTRRPLRLFKREDKKRRDIEGQLTLQKLLAGEEKEGEKKPETKDDTSMKNLEEKIQKLEGEAIQVNKRTSKIEKENEQLMVEKRELEEKLYRPETFTYSKKPVLLYTIPPKNGSKKPKEENENDKDRKAITGMAILENALFVVSEKTSELKVYDSITFNLQRKFNLPDLLNPLDIASSVINKCLYLSDGKIEGREKEILKVLPSGSVVLNWRIGYDGGLISVTSEGNVIVSLFELNQFKEYTSDGRIIKTVRLSPTAEVKHPWHAIKLTTIHFLCSHGVGEDPLHRVCVTKVSGDVIKSFGKKRGQDIEKQQMNRPMHLAEDSARNILVADSKNKRVLLLGSTLDFKRVLVAEGLRFPVRICIDEENGRLFVADNDFAEKKNNFSDGRILVFNLKSKE